MTRRAPRASTPVRSRLHNRLLAALTDDERQRLLPHLREVEVGWKQVIQRAHTPIAHVYFPLSGVFSVVTTLPDGVMVEATTVGNEGLLGIEAYFGEGAIAGADTMLQVPDGRACRLDARVFRRELEAGGTLKRLLSGYIPDLFANMMLSAACNARHSVQERCAKWLLTTHDRAGAPEFRLSHEFLAMMLGSSRPTMTQVANRLQDAGLISYTYGRVLIRNRRALEQAACPCYSAMRPLTAPTVRRRHAH